MKAALVVAVLGIALTPIRAEAEGFGAPFDAIMKRLHKIDAQQQKLSDGMEAVRDSRAKDMVHSTVASMLNSQADDDRKAMTSAAVSQIETQLQGRPAESGSHRDAIRFAARSGGQLERRSSGSGSGSGSLEESVQEAVDVAMGEDNTNADAALAEGQSPDEMKQTAEEASSVKKEEEEAEQELKEAQDAANSMESETKRTEAEAAQLEAENQKKKEEMAAVQKEINSQISSRSQSQSHLQQQYAASL